MDRGIYFRVNIFLNTYNIFFVLISTLFQLATKTVDQEPYKVQFSEKELREKLTPKEYHVTQERGTER